MAERVTVDQHLTVNAVDLSDHLRGSDFAETIEGQDGSRMGTTSRIEYPGLIGRTLTVEFNQDYASAKVDATISPLVSGRTVFAVAWRPDKTAAISATNPEYQFNAFVKSYQRAAGSVGSMDIARVEFGFNSVVTRDVTP